MSKALVIKGVSFATNKVDTVSWVDDKHATSITLDHETLTLANIGTTSQLTASVLPVDTTDVVTWASSDTQIVTVSGTGLVTVTGAGEATITATCGSYSATCVVTTSHTIPLTSYTIGAYASPRDYDNTTKPINRIVLWGADKDQNYAAIYSETVRDKGIYEGSGKYPIYFGKASKLTITAPSNIKVTAQITDSKHSPYDLPDYEGEAYTSSSALWLYSDKTPWASAAPVGNREINVPEGADSVVLTFRKTTADISASDISGVTVVAS